MLQGAREAQLHSRRTKDWVSSSDVVRRATGRGKPVCAVVSGVDLGCEGEGGRAEVEARSHLVLVRALPRRSAWAAAASGLDATLKRPSHP